MQWQFVLLVGVVALLILSVGTGEVSASGFGGFTSNVPPDAFPERLRNHLSAHPWEQGFLDVTKPPYNAAGDGLSDDTEAIQKAVDDAYLSNLVVFFPAGTYLVSDTIYLTQSQIPGEKSLSQRKFGHLLVGSTKGPQRPVIKLRDGAEISGQAVLFFRHVQRSGVESPEMLYIATLRGIDVDMGENPTANAVYMSGAQHCVIQDVAIYGNFNIGIYRVPGSGGSAVNVQITGGKIGILQDNWRPTPLLAGIRLEGQSECGIKVLHSPGTITVTGFHIISPATPAPSYRAIYLNTTRTSKDMNAYGDIVLSDGIIEVRGEGGTAIHNYAQNVVMKNVFVKAETIIESGLNTPPATRVAGNPSAWLRIDKYVYATDRYQGAVFSNGENLRTQPGEYQAYELTAAEPPGDFLQRHVWGKVPSWEDADLVNIVADYGATPEHVNGTDDDTAAIQRAIDDTTTPGHPNYGKTVFIPRGHFHISKPLVLKAGAKVIGAAKNISVIDLVQGFSGDVAVDSEPSASGSVILSDFAILGWAGTAMLHIRTNDTLIRDVVTETKHRVRLTGPVSLSKPYVAFYDDAGGKVYNLSLDHVPLSDANYGDPPPGAPYHLVLVQNTHRPLAFYEISVEHMLHSPQMMIKGASNVSIYGFKYEDRQELLNIRDSAGIQVFGGFGNYHINKEDDRAIIVIENSADLFLANLSRNAGHFRDSIAGKPWVLHDGVQVPADNPVVLYETHPVEAWAEVLVHGRRLPLTGDRSDFNVVVPFATEAVPVVTLVPHTEMRLSQPVDETVTVTISQATAVPGTASVIVRDRDGRVVHTSVITFALAAPNVAIAVHSDQCLPGATQCRGRGQLPVDLKVDGPGSRVQHAVLELVPVVAGELVESQRQQVYAGSTLPAQLVINTLQVDDGTYQVVGRVTSLDGQVAQASVTVVVRNWTEQVDELEPPVQNVFGTFDRSKTVAQSSGWVYATDAPDAFFGDAHRRTRRELSEEYLIWNSPGLHSYTLVIYARLADIADAVHLAVSGDRESWLPLSYEVAEVSMADSGWHRLVLKGQVSDGFEANYFRLTLRESSSAPDAIQLGQVSLVQRLQ